MSRLGYVVHSEDANLIPHSDRLKPRVGFFMNAWGAAAAYKTRYPSAYVIHRISEAEESDMHLTPGKTLSHLKRRAAESMHSRVYKNLFTEPDVDTDAKLKALNDESLLALAWARANNVRVALPHLAHYRMELEQWLIIEPLINEIANSPIDPIDGQPLFIVTVDSYGAGIMFSGVEDSRLPGATNEIKHIPPSTWHKGDGKYWHVGRDLVYWRDRKRRGLKIPIIVVTEYGLDRLQDVEAWLDTLRKAPEYPNIRGWRTLKPQYVLWYGAGISPARIYAKQLVAAFEELLGEFPEIVGACIYAYGTNGDSQWHSFRVDGESDIQNELETAQAGESIVVLPPVSKPADAGLPDICRMLLGYNLRTGPGKAYPVLRAVAVGEIVSVYLNETNKTNADGFTWVWVETDTNAGFMALEDEFFRLVPANWPADKNVRLAVPFASQLNTGTVNNCGEASLTSIFNYIGIKSGRADLAALTVADVINYVNNGGLNMKLSELQQVATHYGVASYVRSNQTLLALRAELDAGRPFIALIDRGDIPGAQAVYKFDGAHYVPVIGYNNTRIRILDPLYPKSGLSNDGLAQPYVNDFVEAWRESDGNTGNFQMLAFDPTAFEPAEPPLEGFFTADELQQMADKFGALAETATAIQSIATALASESGNLARLNQDVGTIIELALKRANGG